MLSDGSSLRADASSLALAGDKGANNDPAVVEAGGAPNGNPADVEADGAPNGNPADVEADGAPNNDPADVEADGAPNNDPPTVEAGGGGSMISSIILHSPARSKYPFGVLNVAESESRNCCFAKSLTSLARLSMESMSS